MHHRAHITLLALCAACRSPAELPRASSEGPLVLSVVSSGGVGAAVEGSALPSPLAVRVTRDGVPVSGEPVTWATTSGSLSVTGSFTDARGIATAGWTLGASASEAEVTAVAQSYHAPESRAVFRITVWPRVDVRAVGALRVGEVGRTTDQPLRIRATRAGSAAAGIPVQWTVSSGTTSTISSVTDQDGFATASWQLGGAAGRVQARAAVRGHPEGPVVFEGVALAGPVASILLASGGAPRPANLRFIDDRIAVRLSDRFGNAVPDAQVAWEILNGPASVEALGPVSDSAGTSAARLQPTGTPGTVTVRVTVNGATPRSQDFDVTFTDPVFAAYLSGWTSRSMTNGSSPAVDTIPAGSTFYWVSHHAEDSQYFVEPVGTPAFIGGGFLGRDMGYGNDTTTALFPVAGTYHWRDAWGQATGTVVVK